MVYENMTCQDCNGPHDFDCVLLSEIWNQIADPSDMLCFKCIDKRLIAKGLTAECEFYACGKNLKSKLYGDHVSGWNDAIEAAAQLILDCNDYGAKGLAQYIRDELKKDNAENSPDNLRKLQTAYTNGFNDGIDLMEKQTGMMFKRPNGLVEIPKPHICEASGYKCERQHGD